ncbi:ATP-binding protein [Aquabacterium sp.]|uniref:ATP-binding protein n=1 Tax=Aquabacterium sp. TaxID=1872578 RepID=UPI002C6B3F6B|nr:ATP-binding protein [Aquabacterium sp.]HSW06003.1 ATP-binding protein [Aquabacterium sp.]
MTWPRVLAGWLVVAGLLLTGPAAAASLDEWRRQLADAQALVENDIPRAHAQAQQLQAQLPTGATPADRVGALNLLSRAEAYLALAQPSAEHARLAMEAARAHGDAVGEAQAQLNISLNFVNGGQSLETLTAATTRGLNLLDGVDRPDLLGEALLRSAMTYLRVGQFDEAVTTAMQALEIAQRSKHPLALAYAHQGLGVALNQSGRGAQARQHFVQMREQARRAGSRLLEAQAIFGMGVTAQAAGELAEAEARLRESADLYRAMGARFILGQSLYGLADFARQRGQPEKALALFTEAGRLYESYANKLGLWYTLNARSDTALAIGRRTEALADAQRAYALAQAIGLLRYRSESAQRMATVMAAGQDHRRAYDYSVEAARLTTQAVQDRAGARLVEVAERFEAESRKREIAELTRRNEQQTAALRQQALQQRWLWTVLAAIIVVLATTAFFLQRLRWSHRVLEQRVQARTAELRQHARYLRTLIDMLPMWAWFKDTGSRYLVANQSHADALGRAADELVGKSDAELLPVELANAHLRDDAEVMSSRQRKTVEEERADRGGSRVWMETYKAPVLDEDGSLLGTVGVARDISEHKAAEAAREEALAEARRLARTRSDFLAQMSHELRSPLNGILGFAQILQRDKPLTERQERGLGIIEQCGQHLLTLIDDTLDLARIDAARLELAPAPVDLPAFLAVVADIVRVKAEEKQVLFTQQVDSRLPHTVVLDEQRLRQVLLNLLANAVKFTDRGQVQLRVQLRTATATTVCLGFEVEDSGIGMNEAQLARLFQPFEQVGEAKRRVGGTGLGLAISRQLVLLMGSDIAVRSRVDQGSCFSFDLNVPLSPTPAAAADLLGLPIGYAGRRQRVLVVDDLRANRAVVMDSLAQLGFDVCEAVDGPAAVTQALNWRPDLIVMDIVMPGLDGFEATRRIHALPELAAVPVILSSGHVARPLEDDSLQAGASAFLAKPIDQHKLLASMGRLLQLRWIRDSAVTAEPPAADVDAAPLLDDLPPALADELHRLALQGDMRLIRDFAERLERDTPNQARLTQQLRSLAQAYQSKAILGLAEHLRGQHDGTAAAP